MMDGRIGVIREALDENGFHETGILAYTAKYECLLRSVPTHSTVPPSPVTRKPTEIPRTWPVRCASLNSTRWKVRTS